MLCSTSFLRVKPGREAAMREALLDLAELTQASEPGTLALVIVQDEQDKTLFALHGRFQDAAALELHNNSDPMTRLLFFARDLLEGPMRRVTGAALYTKG